MDNRDLALAFELADVADATTMRWFGTAGLAITTKADSSPVTGADWEAEQAVRAALLARFPDDGFLGEEVGETQGSSGRRWIVDGIDGTVFFAPGEADWGTLIALERDGVVEVGMITSPALGRRWWAALGAGAYTAPTADPPGDAVPLRVSSGYEGDPERFIVLPGYSALGHKQRELIEQLAGGAPPDRGWSHPLRIASGAADVCVWFGGGPWDLAAPSVIVEEAGGRFTDHWGGRRLDTATAVFSNGSQHEAVLAALFAIR